MQLLSGTSNMLEKYLDVATAQLKITSQNMANLDTPGYKTKGLDFDQEMQSALITIENQSPGAKLDRPIRSSPVPGLISRPDGNDVSIDREGMQMAEAQLKFRTGVALLKQEITQLSEAIHSDSK